MLTFPWLITKNWLETVLELDNAVVPHLLQTPSTPPNPLRYHKIPAVSSSCAVAGAGTAKVGLGGWESCSTAKLGRAANPRPLCQRPDTLLCVPHTEVGIDCSFKASMGSICRLAGFQSGSHYIATAESRVIYLFWFGHHLFSDLTTWAKSIWCWLLSNPNHRSAKMSFFNLINNSNKFPLKEKLLWGALASP